jgi:AcrR family transcriptional regulator
MRCDIVYARRVPKLWTDTIEEHRQAVHDAALDAAAALAFEHGLASMTMSKIAAEAGIGRATLYKYFPDAEAVLAAWHERQITRHLTELAAARDTAGPGAQLEAVLGAWALIQHHHSGYDAEVAALLHQGQHVTRARQHLHDLVAGLIADGVAAGQVRDDTGPGELASYCLHALTAASALPGAAAVRRLLAVTMDGLRPAKRIRQLGEGPGTTSPDRDLGVIARETG